MVWAAAADVVEGRPAACHLPLAWLPRFSCRSCRSPPPPDEASQTPPASKTPRQASAGVASRPVALARPRPAVTAAGGGGAAPGPSASSSTRSGRPQMTARQRLDPGEQPRGRERGRRRRLVCVSDRDPSPPGERAPASLEPAATPRSGRAGARAEPGRGARGVLGAMGRSPRERLEREYRERVDIGGRLARRLSDETLGRDIGERPATWFSAVIWVRWPAVAVPKSTSLTRRSSAIRMFAGFTSRWTTPCS